MTDRHAPSSPIPADHPLAHSASEPAGLIEGTDLAGRPLAGGLAHIDLSLDGIRTRIVVNGQDLSSAVKSYALQSDVANPSRLPVLVIELVPGAGEVHGDGIVQVLPDSDGYAQTLGSAVAEFLDGVDPTDLNEAVMTGGMASDPVEAVLGELRRRARSR